MSTERMRRTLHALVANRWMFAPIGLLGCTVIVATITVTSAVVGHSLGAEPEYDRKAASFEAEREQRVRNERLRWVVTPDIVSDGAHRVVSLRVEDKHAARIEADHVKLECIPVVDASVRRTLELARVGPGEFAGEFDCELGGQWEFRVSIDEGELRYTDQFRRFLTKPQGDSGHG